MSTRNPFPKLDKVHVSDDHQDHSAALALVSTRAPASDTTAMESSEQGSSAGPQQDNDSDMERAMDLMELHHGVKMKHVQGEDKGLMQARRDVDAVLAKLAQVRKEDEGKP